MNTNQMILLLDIHRGLQESHAEYHPCYEDDLEYLLSQQLIQHANDENFLFETTQRGHIYIEGLKRVNLKQEWVAVYEPA